MCATEKSNNQKPRSTRNSRHCPLCKAGVSKPFRPVAGTKRPMFMHPGYPQSRCCAVAHFDCGRSEVELIAWDPSPAEAPNTEPPCITYSHVRSDGITERPRVDITAEQLAQAGLQLVCVNKESRIWRYKFQPLD